MGKPVKTLSEKKPTVHSIHTLIVYLSLIMTMQLVKIDKGDAYIADMFIIAALRLKSLVDGVRSTLGSFTLIFYILYTAIYIRLNLNDKYFYELCQ